MHDTDGFRRTGAAVTFVTMRHVPDADAGNRLLDDVTGQWDAAPRPAGILSLGGYLDTEGRTVLTYAQVSDPEAYERFSRSLTGPAAATAVAYRPYRGVVLDPSPEVPGCVVVATFDVDGPGRQRLIIDSLCDSLESKPADAHPGMLSANFHATDDGTRVLNYAEWTTDEAHVAFLEGAGREGTFRISTQIPGVRPIGFKRFHRHARIA